MPEEIGHLVLVHKEKVPSEIADSYGEVAEEEVPVHDHVVHKNQFGKVFSFSPYQGQCFELLTESGPLLLLLFQLVVEKADMGSSCSLFP